MRRKDLDEILTPLQRRQAARMAMYFPAIAPGHGAMRKRGDETFNGATHCTAKNCHPTEPKHRQDRYVAAGEYILERDRLAASN